MPKYKCDPSQTFANICLPDSSTGRYYSKKDCIARCEHRYITQRLISNKLAYETTMFKDFLEELSYREFDIYVKGGSVLGLKLLQMLYHTYPGPEFVTHLAEFLKLNLLRDWDFSCYTKQRITSEYRHQLDKIASKYHLVPRAIRFILYQLRYPTRIDGEAMFEVSLLESDNRLDLELPMTTMKIKINETNLLHIFLLALMFSPKHCCSVNDLDIDAIKHILDSLEVIVEPSSKGYFIIDPMTPLQTGDISPGMLQFIRGFTKSRNLQQFLITQWIEPNRMLYRLFEKNIPKAQRIRSFCEQHNITKMNTAYNTWLFHPDKMKTLVSRFCVSLGNTLFKLWDTSEPKSFYEITMLLRGVNLRRIILEYRNMGPTGKQLIHVLFGRLYQTAYIGHKKTVQHEQEQTIDSDTDNTIIRLFTWRNGIIFNELEE